MSYAARLADEDDQRWEVLGEALDELIGLARPRRVAVTDDQYMTRPVESTDVRRAFEHWVQVMNKNPKQVKLTPERRRVIQARLKDRYPLADILAAIDGCARSDFHMARGQYRGGTKYNDLTLILRNGSKLEGFRDSPDGRANSGAFL